MTEASHQFEPGELLNRLGAGDRLLKLAQVLDRVPVSTATLYRWMAKGDFPQRVAFGLNSVGWLESEVDNFIASKAVTRT